MKFWKWRIWQWGGWRWIERDLHTIAFVLAVGIIAWIVAFVGRPAEKSGSQPNFAGGEQQQKRLAIFLDGTWNSVDSNTNVWRMRALTATKSADGRPQLVYYSIGVNGFMGGVFGKMRTSALLTSGSSKITMKAMKSSFSGSVGARLRREASLVWSRLKAS